jgi:hypothetical protein
MGGTDIWNKQTTGFHPSICVDIHLDNHTKGSETNSEENSTCQERKASNFVFLFTDKNK